MRRKKRNMSMETIFLKSCFGKVDRKFPFYRSLGLGGQNGQMPIIPVLRCSKKKGRKECSMVPGKG